LYCCIAHTMPQLTASIFEHGASNNGQVRSGSQRFIQETSDEAIFS
jgi:hypothetical protein